MTNVYKDNRLILASCLIINDKKEILLLYRPDHNHYETPGGKVMREECTNPEEPTLEDIAKAAQRECYEELGKDVKVKDIQFFEKVEFTIPDGRLAVANKFIVKITGKPKINEPDKFTKLDYLPIMQLEKYPISPDLITLTPKLKEYAKLN